MPRGGSMPPGKLARPSEASRSREQIPNPWSRPLLLRPLSTCCVPLPAMRPCAPRSRERVGSGRLTSLWLNGPHRPSRGNCFFPAGRAAARHPATGRNPDWDHAFRSQPRHGSSTSPCGLHSGLFRRRSVALPQPACQDNCCSAWTGGATHRRIRSAASAVSAVTCLRVSE